jgi:hypothetical protein
MENIHGIDMPSVSDKKETDKNRQFDLFGNGDKMSYCRKM